MSTVRHLGRRVCALLTTMMAVIGCGGDPDAIAPVPAAGTVSYKGQPIETGTIQFHPAKGRPASGAIKNGQFTLTTDEPDDGVAPGPNQVGVTATKQVPSKTGGEPEEVYVIPVEYATPGTSGVTVEIPPEGKKDIQIELTK